MRWPIGIALGFAIMIAMNIVFIYVAVSTAEEVDPSYEQERR